MKASIGMTKAAVLPEPDSVVSAGFTREEGILTCLSDTNDVPVLQTNRDGLPLDWRGLLVSNPIDNLQYWLWYNRFRP